MAKANDHDFTIDIVSARQILKRQQHNSTLSFLLKSYYSKVVWSKIDSFNVFLNLRHAGNELQFCVYNYVSEIVVLS